MPKQPLQINNIASFQRLKSYRQGLCICQERSLHLILAWCPVELIRRLMVWSKAVIRHSAVDIRETAIQLAVSGQQNKYFTAACR